MRFIKITIRLTKFSSIKNDNLPIPVIPKHFKILKFINNLIF